MKSRIVFTATLVVIVSCSVPEAPNKIIIEGSIKNLPDGKLYLAEAHHWQIPLDSTQCVNGRFVFNMKADSSFAPYKASIWYMDSSKKGSSSLVYRNYMRGKDSVLYGSNAFYLEKGYTKIEGVNDTKPFLRVFAGKETDLLYKYHAGFGRLSHAHSSQRTAIINYYKNQIKLHPYSYFLLRELYNDKEAYAEKEWMEILSLFDDDVQKSSLGNEIRAYLASRTNPGASYPNLLLVNSNDQKDYILNPTASLNMIVFWASWCGLCRKEIPLLKELQTIYKNSGLYIVSVSIDRNRDDWKKALQQEKMSWPQYLVDNESIDSVRAQFNFAAIPLVVFTDRQGKEIMRFLGYDEDQKKNYEAVIKKYIQ